MFVQGVGDDYSDELCRTGNSRSKGDLGGRVVDGQCSFPQIQLKSRVTDLFSLKVCECKKIEPMMVKARYTRKDKT